MRREDVRLLVTHRPSGELEHAHFGDLPELLAPGDLLVINVSATLPAAVPARHEPVRIHFSTRVPKLSEHWRVVVGGALFNIVALIARIVVGMVFAVGLASAGGESADGLAVGDGAAPPVRWTSSRYIQVRSP